MSGHIDRETPAANPAAHDETGTDLQESNANRLLPADDPILAEDPEDWKIWPPSPKVQIILIAVVFGLFNCALAAIVWVVFVT